MESLNNYLVSSGVNSFFTIYDPIIENEFEIVGGPWCFYINEQKAYLAFPTKSLAEDFLDRWSGEGKEHDIIQIHALGDEDYLELLEDVDFFLLLPTIKDITQLIEDVEHFPYQHFLIPRKSELIH